MSATTVTLYSQDSTPNLSTPISPSLFILGGGESFTAPNTAELSQVQFRLARTADVTGTAVAILYLATTIPGGIFIGSDGPLATSNPVDLSTLPIIDSFPMGGLVTFTFPTAVPVDVLAGTKYMLIMAVTTMTGTAVHLFGSNTNPDPNNNGALLSTGQIWSGNVSVDYNMIALGLTTPTATLTVRCLTANLTPVAPVRVTVQNPSLGISEIQTNACGVTDLIFPNLPSGGGYSIAVHYVDCTGAVQDLLSPMFSLSANICITLGFASGGCVSLPNFLLGRFFATGIVDLVGRSAFPDFHHFSLSANPSGIDMIFADVENNATTPLCFTMQYVFTNPDGSTTVLAGITQFTNSVQTTCDFLTLQPGQTMTPSLAFKPTMLGDYSVDVTAFSDTGIPAPRNPSKTKTIKFTVVA